MSIITIFITLIIKYSLLKLLITINNMKLYNIIKKYCVLAECNVVILIYFHFYKI